MMKVLAVLALLALVAATQAIDLPDLTRRWYVAGKFDKVQNADGTWTEATNFAYYDGTKWGIVGDSTKPKGANGPVYAISMDAKFNLLIGGKFTSVNGVATGPVARYNLKDSKWESVVGNAVFQAGAVVHAVGGNCFSKTLESLKKSVTTTRCDVYFGGNFNATLGSTTYKNVARWKQDTETAGTLISLTSPIKGTVYALYKKPVPTLTSDSSDYLWIGGNLMGGTDSMWFGRFEGIEGDSPTWVGLDNGVNGVVKTFAYTIRTLVGSTDSLYVGGNFSFSASDSKRCSGVCHFNHKTKKFTALAGVASPNFDNAMINDIGLNGNTIVVGGKFSAPFSNLAKLGDGKTSWDTIHGSQTTEVTYPVVTLDVCSKFSKSCKAGSVATGGADGSISFFNQDKDTWTKFGKERKPLNSSSGSVVLNNIYSYAGASTAQITVAAVAVVAALAIVV